MPIYTPGKVVLAKQFTWNETVWNPSMIQAALWLDAADTATIFTSGSEVTQINDKSGNSRNFTGTSGSRPSTGVETQNGKNVLSLDGDFLTSSSAASTWKFLHDSTGSSVFSVVTFGTSSNPDTAFILLGSSGAATANIGLSMFYDDRLSLSRNNAFVLFVNRGLAGTTAASNVSLDVATPNSARIITALTDPANGTAANRSIVRIDAGPELKNSTATDALSTADPTFTLQIGSGGNGALPFTGKLAEIIIVSGIVSAANRERIEGYLAHKWGLTANLPAGHPYKTVGPTP